MPDHPNVRRFLDLSTAHISPETRNLWSWTDEKPVHVDETSHGFFVWAGTDEDADADTDEGWPSDAAACRKLARSLGCDYILFDAGASTIAELKVFADG